MVITLAAQRHDCAHRNSVTVTGSVLYLCTASGSVMDIRRALLSSERIPEAMINAPQ